MNGLILSGLSMQVYGGTRPASGAEHYFSHLWELDHLGQTWDPPLSHGFKVAIGTLAMCAFYERFMARDLAALDVDAAVAAWPSWAAIEADIRARLSGSLADHCVKETRTKYLDAEGLRQRLTALIGLWPEVRARLQSQLKPARELQTMLREAGAPSVPEDIGLTAEQVKQTFHSAAYYRSRYSVLDLNYNAGSAGAATPAGGIRGGRQETWTAGVNWYLNASTRLTADYQHVDVDRLSPGGTAFGAGALTPPAGAQIGQTFNIFSLRAQISF